MAYYDDVPPESVTPTYREPTSSERAGILKELSPDKKIMHLVRELKGKLWDSSKNKYVEVEGSKPLMNDAGINTFIHQATTILNPIVTLSNYRKEIDEIHRIVMMVIKRASTHYTLNWQRYGMQDKYMAKVVVDKLMILGISAFYKALGAGDRSAGTKNITESMSTVNRDEGYPQQRNRGGFFQNLMPRSNR